jgi:arginine/lysine/ornithine decarboxylase
LGILLEKLRAYSESDFYPYHMPGHKRQQTGTLPESWTRTDITEIDGFDNLHQAEGILRELQKKAASAYGAQESFYLVNGSTGGILSAISAAVPFG